MPENLTKIWDNMVLNYGKDWHQWPILGCGRGFVAYSKGPSMCLNVHLENNSKSIACVRPPDIIRDAFDVLKLGQLSQVLRKVGLENLFLLFTLAFPIHEKYQVRHRGWTGQEVSMVGFCKYPLEDWRSIDRPFFTNYGWWFFAMVMSMGAQETGQTSLIDLLWHVRKKGGHELRDEGEG